MKSWNPNDLQTAREIVARLKEIQATEKLSDRALVDAYPDLVSTRTWGRWRNDDWSHSHPERTLQRLRRIAALLDGGSPVEEFYPLPFYQEFARRVAMLERTINDRRILVCLAPNGTGKTTAARRQVELKRATRKYCRLRPAWRNKELHIATGMLAALGADAEQPNAAQAEKKLVEALSSVPVTLFLDQAHEGGPALMHLLRMLVDETPSRFVYLGYDTAFRRVQLATTDAMIEARAFLGRCLKPIFDDYRHGTRPEDVAAYLQAAAGLGRNPAASLAGRITPILQRTTNLRLLDDALAVARAQADEDDPDPEAILQACYSLAGMEPAPSTHRDQDEQHT